MIDGPRQEKCLYTYMGSVQQPAAAGAARHGAGTCPIFLAILFFAVREYPGQHTTNTNTSKMAHRVISSAQQTCSYAQRLVVRRVLVSVSLPWTSSFTPINSVAHSCPPHTVRNISNSDNSIETRTFLYRTETPVLSDRLSTWLSFSRRPSLIDDGDTWSVSSDREPRIDFTRRARTATQRKYVRVPSC